MMQPVVTLSWQLSHYICINLCIIISLPFDYLKKITTVGEVICCLTSSYLRFIIVVRS